MLYVSSINTGQVSNYQTGSNYRNAKIEKAVFKENPLSFWIPVINWSFFDVGMDGVR